MLLLGALGWFVRGRFAERETASPSANSRSAGRAPAMPQASRGAGPESRSEAAPAGASAQETRAAAEALTVEPPNPDRALTEAPRAATTRPRESDAYVVEMQGYIANQRWHEAEQAARRALAFDAGDMRFHRVLARALVMQNRDEDAAEALRRALVVSEDPAMRTLLTQIERRLAHVRSLNTAGSAHFSLHAQEGASNRGRELLDFLERQYWELARTFEYEPGVQIPVILFAGREGLAASGASGWARATYDHSDGRIRIGMADLSNGITGDIEQILIHELAHAFIRGRTRGNVPRDINEGLAQHLSGKRPRPVVINTRILDLGPNAGVEEYYEAALSFVDFLLRRHGQRYMNQLLEALGREPVDQAFRRVYGFGYAEARQAWVKQLP